MSDKHNLLPHIHAAYADSGEGKLSNESLYRAVARSTGLIGFDDRVPIGKRGALYSLMKRKVRWYQQTLKQLGVIERVDGPRGIWSLTEHVKDDLHKAIPGARLVAFSTDLGIAVWGDGKDLFRGLGEPIHLYLSSPPYPLKDARAYGNPTADEFPGYICDMLEPIVRNLVPGGSIVLNISNNIFEDHLPSRSLYVEKTIIALNENLKLSKMDSIPWINKSKPPGPTVWACRERVQLSAAYEHCIWLTNDPSLVLSRVDRVLEPHTDKHKALMASGGDGRNRKYGDGSYHLRPHSFGKVTEGKLPRNILERGHSCADSNRYRKEANAIGLRTHGAMMPTSVADFFVKFLTKEGDLVVDNSSGTGRTGLAAQRNNRRWIMGEWMLQYLRGSANLFRDQAGFSMHPALAAVSDWNTPL